MDQLPGSNDNVAPLLTDSERSANDTDATPVGTPGDMAQWENEFIEAMAADDEEADQEYSEAAEPQSIDLDHSLILTKKTCQYWSRIGSRRKCVLEE